MLPFGETVLLWRSERRMSQETLAQRAYISRPNLSAIEKGKREVSLKTLRSLAVALEVSPGILVDGVGPWFKDPKPLSREVFERVAEAVVNNGPVSSDREIQLVDLLRLISRTQLMMARNASKSSYLVGKKRVQAAWLKLSSAYSPEDIQSFIRRIMERKNEQPIESSKGR